MSGHVDLRSGAMTCRLCPALGGAVLALRWGGLDLLRSVDSASNILDAAAFPLVPFANRIGNACFSFRGSDVALRADPAAFPHAHHGEGWRREWWTETAGTDHAVFAYKGGEDWAFGWPWRYLARQHVRVTHSLFSLQLEVTNLDPDRPMPLGLGWHPYFPRSAGSALSAQTRGMWVNDPSGLAIRREPTSLFSTAPVPLDLLDRLDNFFVCANPAIGVRCGSLGLLLEGQGAGFHLFAPANETWFCVEPVSHAPNAFGRGEFAETDVIQPGQTKRQGYTLRITDHPTVQGAVQ
ncbi:hypothetical protein H7F50_11280 [Novosphingobium flavum]|uniref:Aldose 1-epimerase n=1 Tax=Novosphingobium aerophilum TaxID=2839843 RepID=A0A7X1F8J4_9SPHN|nr:hypothetical protein [Novosphingobium aerophilum]MBC2652388.1 hypothetical protein [Novosphingobium aerophilum]MBC2662339.1 hypothetical protein [Novosphingobium aerophilum]